MSANQFLEQLFGILPEFFKDEDELRKIWSDPTTRATLLRALEDKHFGTTQLEDIQRAMGAENSDLYDVLAYIRFALPPIPRTQRADLARPRIAQTYDARKQAFLEFVLSHYVDQGVQELDSTKLSALVALRYGSATSEVMRDLGPISEIRELFLGFQPFLYPPVA